MRNLSFPCLLSGLIFLSSGAFARNIIVMISDGASIGTWDAGSLALHGERTASTFYGEDWSKLLMTTRPLEGRIDSAGTVASISLWEEDKAWQLEAYTDEEGYLHQGATDSAAAATAMSSGRKTCRGAINWGPSQTAAGAAITPNLPELAHQAGLAVGTVSTVQWAHATPAGFSNAHQASRGEYASIARQMLEGGVMDLIMGAGHPQFDNNARPVATLAESNEDRSKRHRFVGGVDSWHALKDGTHSGGWLLLDNLHEFTALADGRLAWDGPLVATARVASTMQQGRDGYAVTDKPFEDELNEGIPGLDLMSLGALKHLHTISPEGFFLQIEGGAVDWAAHGNMASRIVEEQVDFEKAVDTVTNWIEANGGWEENLLIVTTDHGNAMPQGPDSDRLAFDRIEKDDLYHGQYVESENENGLRFWSTSHTVELVPLFVRGEGAEGFRKMTTGRDQQFARIYADWAQAGFDGSYVDNTAIFSVVAPLLQKD